MNKEGFYASASLRQAIWYKKEHGEPWPWSEDEKMNTTFFCNVFRRQDKTTIKITDLLVYAVSPADLIKKIVVARNLSYVGTLEELEPWFEKPADPDALDHILALRYARGEKIHTGGFIVVCGTMAKWRLPGLLCRTIDPATVLFANTIEGAWQAFVDVPWIGPFMAYEYATDLSYFKTYPDRNTWSNPGPGAKRGMSRVWYGDIRHLPSYSEYQEKSQELYSGWTERIKTGKVYDELYDRIGKGADEAIVPFLSLSMREVEHWLCEYDKYSRSGHNKRRYPNE